MNCPAPWPFALLGLLLALPAGAAETRPIVAVFAIEAPDKLLAAPKRAVLTDFLAARLAASDHYRTVPRTQIKQRLGRLRKESYRDCYDQTCQIEIGRELAASKALSTRVIAIGDRCELTLELFDLKTAATELAHTASGGCDEQALFATVSAAVGALVNKKKKAPAIAAGPAPAPTATAQVNKVSLYVRSKPAGAEVLVDGLSHGKTPLHLPVPRGKRLALTLRCDGCRPARRTVTAHDTTYVEVPMSLTPEGRLELATTSEWFGLGFGVSNIDQVGSGAALQVRLASIKSRYFFWTLLEFNVRVITDDTPGAAPGNILIGTHAGYPLYLGARGQHQLLFGLGAGYYKIFSTSSGRGDIEAFGLTQGIDYTYNAYDGLFPLGLGVRVTIPIGSEVGDRPPWAVTLTANIGLSIYRLAKGALSRTRRARR